MSRRVELFFPSVDLDRDSRVPLQRQIYREIASAIRAGDMKADARLPSTRMLARALHVSRNTVLAAYEELAADGLIRGKPGSGMLVNSAAIRSRGILHHLQNVIREANYPTRVLAFSDPDGNSLYFNV